MPFKVRDQTEWRNKLLTLLGETNLTWEKILAKTVARLEVSEPYRQRLCKAMGLPLNEAWTDLWPKLEAALKRREPSVELSNYEHRLHVDLEKALGQRGKDVSDLLDKVADLVACYTEASKRREAQLARALGVTPGERSFDSLVGMVELLVKQQQKPAPQPSGPSLVDLALDWVLEPLAVRLSRSLRYAIAFRFGGF